jgi:hypothetical protein
MQLTLHELPEQRTLPHVLDPVQPTVVAVALLETSGHARSPTQLTEHVFPLHEIAFAQESGSLHWTAHVDAVHTIGPVHVPDELHPTLHSSPLHAMVPVHAPGPAQLMSHELAMLHSIVDVHDPAPTHVTLHGMPGGQMIGVVQEPAAMQVTMQVPAGSHVPTPASAQVKGHTALASILCTSLASPASLEAVPSSVRSSLASMGSSASPPSSAGIVARPG